MSLQESFSNRPPSLQERLSSVAQVMSGQGATKPEILLYQLYLICIAKSGLLGARYGEAGRTAPFDRLAPVLDRLGRMARRGDPDPVEGFLSDEELARLNGEVYGYVFNELLNRMARGSGSEFDHLQPRELTELVYRLCGDCTGKKVYNPYAGVASYAGAFRAGDCYYAEEYDPVTWGIGVLRTWMDGCLSSNYVCGDSLSPGWETPFDIVVSTPPAGRIPNSLDTFCDRLVSDAPHLLADGGEAGTLVMVAHLSSLMGRRGQALVESGLLDMVVVLPGNVLYWTAASQAVIRLRKGRGPDEPVALVDGTAFYSPGGRGTRVIRTGDLLDKIGHRSPVCVAMKRPSELRECGYVLIPALHLRSREEEDGEGRKMIPLRDLGRLLSLPPYQPDGRTDAMPERAVTISDLTSEPCLADVEPHPVNGHDSRFRVLDQPALLIFANLEGIRVGYAHASPENPVCIYQRIHAFAPDEELVSIRYLAHVLARTDTGGLGDASSVLVSRADLLMVRVPVVLRREQDEVVRRDLEAFNTRRTPSRPRPRKKPGVAVVGEAYDLPAVLGDGLHVRKSFSTPGEAKEWVSGNRAKLDAIIVVYTAGMDTVNVIALCTTDVPVYFLSSDLPNLELLFGNSSEQYLKGRSFEIGAEQDLFEALLRETDERNTPQWLVRRRYSRELAAAMSIEKRFPAWQFSLHDILEEILLSEETRPDWRNKLRSIRDDCYLKVLVDYGFLPPVDGRSFSQGAQLDLLSDRCFAPRDRDYRLVMAREVVPADLAELIRASRHLLNEGSHSLSGAEWDLQMSALFIVMAALCHLADMIDRGLFDEYDPDRNRQAYIKTVYDDGFEPGIKPVRAFREDPGYLYADNIHLDARVCRSLRVKPGDSVDVRKAMRESEPKLTDTAQILFYSKDFMVVPGR